MTGPAASNPDGPRPVALQIAEEALARALAADTPWPTGATVVAAVSGGADSLCLLGALLAAQTRGGANAPGTIVVATLDHGLRGEAGAADARWVAELAGKLGVRCFTERAETRALAQAGHISLEDAARRLRYAFLRRVAREVGAARICLGHTLDDQAETIILHLLRGSGLDGLAGMRSLRGDLARPLLELTHSQAVAYCAARGWLPREDTTNRDERYLRNRVRRRLLPLLEAYNPNIRRTLARNAALIAEDLVALESATDRAWDKVVVREGAASVAMDLTTLREQTPALRRRLWRRAALRLTRAAGDEATSDGALEARHIALIERLLAQGRTGATLTLPDGLRAYLDYDALRLARAYGAPSNTGASATNDASDASAEWTLPVPGAVDVEPLGWRVLAAPLSTPPGLEGDALPPIPREPPMTHAGTTAFNYRGELRVYLDADTLGDTLTVRAWRPGDRFRPLGMAQSKKLQDVFSDAKTPRALRHRLPIVCSGERIVWVAGVRIADEFKLTLATRHALALQAEPLTPKTEESET